MKKIKIPKNRIRKLKTFSFSYRTKLFQNIKKKFILVLSHDEKLPQNAGD